MRISPTSLEYVPDHFKTQEMCNEAAEEEPSSLRYVPDYFVTQQQIKIWHDEYYDGGHWYDWYDKFFVWYEGHQKQKAQKALIKEELLPIAWHP